MKRNLFLTTFSSQQCRRRAGNKLELIQVEFLMSFFSHPHSAQLSWLGTVAAAVEKKCDNQPRNERDELEVLHQSFINEKFQMRVGKFLNLDLEMT